MGNQTIKETQKCELFGEFGFVVQFSLGIFSFMCLISNPSSITHSKTPHRISKTFLAHLASCKFDLNLGYFKARDIKSSDPLYELTPCSNAE
jgi:hypothetical protein